MPNFRVLALLACSACVSAPTGPEEPNPLVIDGDVRILFVGNSLTYTNNLPGTVEAVAAAAGLDVGTGMIAFPNFSLADHWNRGLGDVIQEVAPDFVVLQQGPSSTPENQAFLKDWTRVVARAVADAGGKTALLMVWPSRDQTERFDLVRDSYLEAAASAGGWFIPAGEAFRPLLADGSPYSPFSPDGFHPSEIGTVLSAFVLVGALLDQSVAGLPLTMEAPGGSPSFVLQQEAADLLQPLADSVVAAWAASQPDAGSALRGR